MPKPKSSEDKEKDKDKTDAAGGSHEGAGRRLLEKVGHIVQRKPKIPGSDTSKPAGAQAVKETAKDTPPSVPPKAEAEATAEVQAAADSDAKPTDGVVSEEKREEPAAPIVTEEAKAPKSPGDGHKNFHLPPSVTAKATKLARRLSAGGLGAVFHHTKPKSPGSAPPVSKGGVEAQALAPEAQDTPPKPVAEEKAQAEDETPQPAAAAGVEGVAAPSDDKPAVENAKAEVTAAATDDEATAEPAAAATHEDSKPVESPTKMKSPPTAFNLKSATKVARRISTRAGELLKPKEEGRTDTASKAPAYTKTESEADSKTKEEGLVRTHSKTPSVAAATEKASELARKISTKAHDAIVKARAKAKGESATAGEATKTQSDSDAADAKKDEAKPDTAASAAPVVAEVTAAAPETSSEALKADGATEEVKEASPTVVDDKSAAKNEASTETPVAAPEKSLPSPPHTSSFAPSASIAVARVGKLSRRISNRVSGIFHHAHASGSKEGAEAPAAAAPAATEGHTAVKDDGAAKVADSTTEEKETVAKVEESGAAAAEDKPNVDAEAATEVKPAVATEEKEAVIAPAVTEDSDKKQPDPAVAPEKALPSPPPSASASIAKVGQLTRRLSSRVGSVFKTHSIVGAPIEDKSVDSAAKKDDATPKTEEEKGAETKKEGEAAESPVAPAAAELKVEEAKEAQVSSSKMEPAVVASEEKDGEKVKEEQKEVEPTITTKDATPTPEAAAAADPSTSTTTTAPGAFRAGTTKLGRRLSARVGDLFRSKPPQVPAKGAEAAPAKEDKSDASAAADPTSEVVVVSKDAAEKVEGTDPAAKVVEDAKEATEGRDTKEAGFSAEEPKAADSDKNIESEAISEAKEDVKPEIAVAATSTSEPAPETAAETQSDKPLPAKPSRSARARGAAADVGRQLSMKAAGVLNRPRLEEIAAKVPSAFSSRDKGKQKDGSGDGPEASSASPEGSGGVPVKENLGKKFSKVVVDGIFGTKDKDSSTVKRTSSEVKKEHVDEGWEKVDAEKGETAAKESEPAAGASPIVAAETKTVKGEGEKADKSEAEAEGPKNASNEAVEGTATEPPAPTKEADTAAKPADSSKPSAPLSTLVTGLFKPKHKSGEKHLAPSTDGHSHEPGTGKSSKEVTGTEDEGKGETRKRRLSLGFLSKKKKEKDASTAKGDEIKQAAANPEGEATKDDSVAAHQEVEVKAESTVAPTVEDKLVTTPAAPEVEDKAVPSEAAPEVGDKVLPQPPTATVESAVPAAELGTDAQAEKAPTMGAAA